MPDSAARATLFHGLSDPVRMELLNHLTGGGQRVSDLVAATNLGQPSVSKHLACLWECGLVERERRGREVHYRLADELQRLLAAADSVLERSGDRVRSCPRYGYRAALLSAA